MSRPAFLALGDLHLKPHIWSSHRQVVGDAFVGFTSFIDLALELFLPVVLVGDIFDSVKLDPVVTHFFRKEMDRCAGEGLPVYAIQGNHDKQHTPWYTALHDHVQHIGDGQPVDIGGVICRGLDYALKDQIHAQLADISQQELPQCLFLHQATRQALKFEGRWNCDLQAVPEGIPLIVMGDIHREWHQTVRPGQEAYYTGPLCAQDISQVGPKTCMMIHQDLTIERLPIAYREIQRFRFTAPDLVRQANDWLETLDKEPVLPPVAYVEHTPDVGVALIELAEQWDGKAIVIGEQFASPEELELSTDDDRQTVDEVISVDELLTRLIDPEEEPEAFQLVLDLINRVGEESIVDIINTHRDKFRS